MHLPWRVFLPQTEEEEQDGVRQRRQDLSIKVTPDRIQQLPGLMKDHGQQARASENFAGPVDFETPRPDMPVHF